MSWLDPADQTPVVRARLRSARESVAAARVTVVACRSVAWVEAAADRFRAALDDERWRLDRLVVGLDALLAELGIHGPWPVTLRTEGLSCRGYGGRSVRVGEGVFVAVDPEALADVATRLGKAAASLDEASGDLSRALWGTATPWQSGGSRSGLLDGRVDALLHGPSDPGGVADRLRGLAATTRAVAALHADGETRAHAGLRGLTGLAWHWPVAAAIESVPALVVAGARADLSAGWALLTGRDPAGGLVHAAEQAWSDAVAGGAVEVATVGLAAALDSLVRVPGLPSDPVQLAAAALAALAARGAGDVELVPRVDPPQLSPPRGLTGILDLVGKSYDESQPTGLPGTPTATVTVERLDHPDGTRSWVVAVPGTQSWWFSDDVATDMGTNVALVGGLDDPMTAGVLAAMSAAGIASDEPVVLAGHSQGGMVAMSAAAVAAGAYRVAGVVTAGSPSVPERLPSGVPLVRLEHDEDVVPQTDGRPTVAGGDVTRITRSLADDRPVLPTEAHEITGYLDTASRVDAGLAAEPGSVPAVAAVTEVLGGEGTTATTFQYRVERASAPQPAGPVPTPMPTPLPGPVPVPAAGR